MSDDLIKGLVDPHGVDLKLTVRATGHGALSVGDQPYAWFELPPTPEGVKAAETIITALREWQARQRRPAAAQPCRCFEKRNVSGPARHYLESNLDFSGHFEGCPELLQRKPPRI